MAELPSEQIFLVNEEVAHREVEGQLLLLLPDEYDLYTLNPAGKLVWQELIKGRPVGQIAARLAKRYRLSPERAGADVWTLLEDLESRGIVRRA